ncbi:glycoprotease family-domain-containing protein [Hypomontagnella monticulosa]|nr:glycoprotease family-domain-containing protein [Hypomontagnella monticulosa]
MRVTCPTPTWPLSWAWIRHSFRPRASNLRSASHLLSSISQPLQLHPLTSQARSPRRRLLTLAIETSCDDTCVAILEKVAGPTGAARLLFNKKLTSDNREFRGVNPTTAVASHTRHLAAMVREAMRALPETSVEDGGGEVSRREDVVLVDGQTRKKPDFVTVTRGPGMMSNLSTGLNTAKGLAVAWGVPLLGVNHMQAHALTPRLVSALEAGNQRSRSGQQQEREVASQGEPSEPSPAFPFLSLLVSGGHSLLVLSRALNDHAILAEAHNIAIGDMLDKCARAIVPASEIAAGDSVMYGPLLERFAFSGSPSDIDYEYQAHPTREAEVQTFDSGLGWTLTPPLHETAAMHYDFSGLNGRVLKVLLERPDMDVEERRLLAKQTMRLAFEHLASRLLLALSPKNGDADEKMRNIRTVVVAGGVASNRYLMHILRSLLDVRGYGHIELVCPPLPLCTDNAAMIAWTGMEMYEAGWRSELDILAIRKWPLDPNAEGGGILGAPGWRNAEDDKKS